MTVAVAARYGTARAGLRALLSESRLIRVVTELQGPDPRAVATAGARAVVIEDQDGERWADALQNALPELAVVLLGVPPHRASARLPSRAYLSSEVDGADLAAAVTAAARGLLVVDPVYLDRLVGLKMAAEASLLTPRETEVLLLVAQGLPNKSIASQLGMSDHTVKFHVASLLSKLDAASRTEAVVNAARQGLLTI